MQLKAGRSFITAGCLIGAFLCLVQPLLQSGQKSTLNARSLTALASQDTSKAKIELTAKVLFDQAQKGAKKKLYWKSAIDLIVILEYYPEFTKIEEATYLLASCLYEMEMYHAADRIYRHLLEDFPKTTLFTKAALGLQKTYYQQGEYQQSLKFYNALESHYPEDKAIDESRYYAGQAHYHLRNYTLVPNITQLVDKSSNFYPFARYTEALVHLKKKNVRDALERFIELRDMSAKNADQAEIIDASRLTLGYMFFELSDFKRAIEYLVEISPQFYDYPEVLLTLGWCAYKLEDYRASIDALTSLIKDHPNDHLVDEAHFVLGQCYLKLGYFNFAINEFDVITASTSSLASFAEYGDRATLEIANQEKLVEKLKTELLVLETKLLQNLSLFAASGPDFAAKERERMREVQEQLIEQIIAERSSFEDVTNQLSDFRVRIQKAEVQKKWLSYAEYGKARALYLKGVANQ